MGLDDLPRAGLKNVCPNTVQNTGVAFGQSGAVAIAVRTYVMLVVHSVSCHVMIWRTLATGFDTNQTHILILDEVVECPNGIAAAAYASNNNLW